MKAATTAQAVAVVWRHISIHAAREGGDQSGQPSQDPPPAISIHAAREGGDPILVSISNMLLISIHAAREGGDVNLVYDIFNVFDFNPRRP